MEGQRDKTWRDRETRRGGTERQEVEGRGALEKERGDILHVGAESAREKES